MNSNGTNEQEHDIDTVNSVLDAYSVPDLLNMHAERHSVGSAVRFLLVHRDGTVDFIGDVQAAEAIECLETALEIVQQHIDRQTMPKTVNAVDHGFLPF